MPADALAAARRLHPAIRARAAAIDAAAAYPDADIADLAAAGLLGACLPADFGGIALGHGGPASAVLCEILTMIGAASLTVGRLYEGHVNAVRLVATYAPDALPLLAAEIAAGRPSGVWNAERANGLSAVRIDGGWQLSGSKIHCSGSGAIRRPLVTARIGDDGPLMMLPEVAAERADLSVWRAAGMRGTATGTVDFTGLVVPDAAVIGVPGDYYRSPFFSGGAWRVLAVQLGGLDAVMALHAEKLNLRGGTDAVPRARLARAGAAHEAARLIVREAAARAERDGNPAAIDAYVDLARGGFEELALTCIEATRRNIGLGSFIAPDPLDRVLRDLETYLRQPFLDASRDNAAAWLLDHEGRFQ
ncbi:acyl-CoA dehydrogenase [Sphingomonas qilianensis]|uniref:Acyl-CoA dehydrogenase family protein n=1 Tax=Sphingomonas qilianensis TaxID=1736690 RepID=A0ABU9XUN8_9SPHN